MMRIALPDAPALVAGAARATLVTPDGEIETLRHGEAAARLRGRPHYLCHARATARRLGLNEGFAAFDLLELFAFVHPTRFCRPTPRGLAEVLGIAPPSDAEGEALVLIEAAQALLKDLAAGRHDTRSDAAGLAWLMGRAGWPWGPAVLAALGNPQVGDGRTAAALQIWRDLPEWSEHAPEPSPGSQPVEPAEARRRLAELLGRGGRGAAEPRPQQSDYASAVSAAFAPRPRPDSPLLVLAEAGTGTGKTLGYLAPASVWADKNGAPVWISTYTRNLQNQIDGELDRLYPDPSEKARQVVVRKGRENYLCLLNLEEAGRATHYRSWDTVAVGLMTRWAAGTRDGDLVGGDFPGWLPELMGRERTLGLADRRGECIYAACPHYDRCFIEKSVRKARRASIVVANHALVLLQAALSGLDDRELPTRYVFDEGHHLFDAADSAFAGRLTGMETTELRRWLLGAEGGRSRARGLKRRVEDLLGDDAVAWEQVELIVRYAARILPSDGWAQRLAAANPNGPVEAFLDVLRTQVLSRAAGADGPYSLECEAHPTADGLLEAAAELDRALAALLQPLQAFVKHVAAKLEDEPEALEAAQRLRLDATMRAVQRRAVMPLLAWRAMLEDLKSATPPEFVDWFAIERVDGRDFDLGMFRHWIDPTRPFAQVFAKSAHGFVVTSATLTDGTGDPEGDWLAAEERSGARHLPSPAFRAKVPSPFHYPEQTRVLVVTDVRKDDLGQVAAAYRALFEAAGGGGLGLFTAIARLRAVHERIAVPLEAAGLPLYAQHVDGLDVSTLVDIFRGEEHACLLGTDAVRDGVDVPGRSLRLLVFD
ncbi:MAG TPA: ATP-dependent DNA helicase, partial [Alphaproteobacteria bacterium]|nr:ATP-dependent DNA helicase [Alphaproteobacteria bacterium]